jgi:ubiquinone/menaquinone biosynthesis C-methylase UbiE
MKDNGLTIFGRYYDQIYLNRKNYQNEAEILEGVIKQFERKESKTLLDVGCGTGEHLKHLSTSLQCKGIDINREMIKTARSKVPNVEFHIADMMNFRLEEKFDVITCLFSSIGCVQNFKSLVATLTNFRNHLNSKGLTIIEPWIFKKDFRKGNVGIDTYEDDKINLARMATSKLTKSQWLVHMHYLIGTNGEIKHVQETHKMLAADYEDYVKAFNSAGYSETRFLEKNLWTRSRDLFAAIE